jgi:cell wall-associated NlpC family hydrolase
MDRVVREPFTASTPAEAAAAHAVKVAERRATVVAVAEQYLGVPYVLGGASGYGIDCSGLTMVAYAAIGIPLFHLVSSQDAVGTPIPLSAIQPGDLLVFDDHEHIAMFVGGGTIIQAPEPGRTVELTPISDWSGVAFHAIRLIS